MSPNPSMPCLKTPAPIWARSILLLYLVGIASSSTWSQRCPRHAPLTRYVRRECFIRLQPNSPRITWSHSPNDLFTSTNDQPNNYVFHFRTTVPWTGWTFVRVNTSYFTLFSTTATFSFFLLYFTAFFALFRWNISRLHCTPAFVVVVVNTALVVQESWAVSTRLRTFFVISFWYPRGTALLNHSQGVSIS